MRPASMTPPEPGELRELRQGVTWEEYESIDAARDEGSVPRLTYLDGTLELMTPGRVHEEWGTRLGRLIEAYADEAAIDLNGVGSWTIKVRGLRGAAEPDECYVLGPIGERTAPDFAIEVVVTSGGVDKLAVYRRLGVPEVWFYAGEKLEIHQLTPGGYVRASRSLFLPDLDPGLLERCMREPSQSAAVRALREALRA